MKRLAALLGCALLLAGCKVDARVSIRLDENGGGAVALRLYLDAEAVEALETGGGTLEESVLLDDLASAGWKVGAWERGSDGSATMRLSQPFADEGELEAALRDLVGENGLLRDPRLERQRGFLRSSDGVALRADLSDLSAGVASDGELSARLQAAGLDPAALDERYTDDLEDAFSLSVTLDVPRGTQRTFRLAPGEEESLNLSSSEYDADRLVTVLIAALLAFLALLLYLSATVSGRRRRRRGAPPPGSRAVPPLW